MATLAAQSHLACTDVKESWDPKAAYRYNTRGVAECRAGKWQAAIEALTCCDLDAVAPSVRIGNLLYLAMSHAKSGDRDAAQKVLHEAMELIHSQPEDDEDVDRAKLMTEAGEVVGQWSGQSLRPNEPTPNH